MNHVKVLIGFIPLVAFSVLSTSIGAGWAALASLAAAAVITATTMKDGIKTIPAVQAVILLAIAVLAFTGGPPIDDALVKYGPALQGLLLGFFMVATAATMPFTAQYARSTVPSSVWHTHRFLEVNRHISTVWGLAILFNGVCHLAGAEIATTGWHVAVRLAVSWVLPLAALAYAAVYTKRTEAAALAEHRAYDAAHGDNAHEAGSAHEGNAHEAGQIRT